MNDTLEEHRAIITALEARDPPRARAATQTHLRKLQPYLAALEKDRPELFAPT